MPEHFTLIATVQTAALVKFIFRLNFERDIGRIFDEEKVKESI
jgi:hypothetical protein